MEQTAERLFEAELHRLRGEVVRAAGDPEAEACLHRTGRGLPASGPVAGIAGRPAKGRSRLADTLAGFTEGFDTPGLREAQALLAEFGP